MFRKVVFSKEPTALRLESTEDAIFLAMKHRNHTFALGGRGNLFGLYPSALASAPASASASASALHRPYFTVGPVSASASPVYRFITDHLQADSITSPQLYLGPTGTVSLSEETGCFQVEGPSSTWMSLTSNALHIQGDIFCRQLYTDTPAPAAGAGAAPSLPLDAHGKIPLEYLPEAYATTLLHQYAGVGIGTEAPAQKLHIEGGQYLRDRLGIGTPTPSASLTIASAPSSDPRPIPYIKCLNSQEQPIFQLTDSELTISPPLTVSQLTIPNIFTYRPTHHQLRLSSPTYIDAPLYLKGPLLTQGGIPLQCAPIVSSGWTLPLPTAADASAAEITPPPTPTPGFKGTLIDPALCRMGFHGPAWTAAYHAGDEVALLTMRDDAHIEIPQLLAYLYETIQELRTRLQSVEKQLSVN